MDTIITLDNGKKYVIVLKIPHKGGRYLFLSGYDDLEMLFAEIVEEDVIEFVDDQKLIRELISTAMVKLKNDPHYDKFFQIMK